MAQQLDETILDAFPGERVANRIILFIVGEGADGDGLQRRFHVHRCRFAGKVAGVNPSAVKRIQNSMTELAELRGARSEDFFGMVERFQAEHVAREKLKRAAGIGFQRRRREAALGKMFPVAIEVGERAVVRKQAVTALIDCGDDLASLPVKRRQRSRGFDQRGGILSFERQANRQFGRQQ